ncbi:hypothetical protein ACROYT_G015508 [Oculina patagonica]
MAARSINSTVTAPLGSKQSDSTDQSDPAMDIDTSGINDISSLGKGAKTSSEVPDDNDDDDSNNDVNEVDQIESMAQAMLKKLGSKTDAPTKAKSLENDHVIAVTVSSPKTVKTPVMDKSKPKERSTDTKSKGLTTPVAESPKTPVMDKSKQKEASTDTRAKGQKTPVAYKSKPKEKSADTIKEHTELLTADVQSLCSSSGRDSLPLGNASCHCKEELQEKKVNIERSLPLTEVPAAVNSLNPTLQVNKKFVCW